MCSPMPNKPDMPDVNADELVDIGANAGEYSSSYQHEIDPSWSINPSWSTKTINPSWSTKTIKLYEGVLGKAIKPSVLENYENWKRAFLVDEESLKTTKTEEIV